MGALWYLGHAMTPIISYVPTAPFLVSVITSLPAYPHKSFHLSLWSGTETGTCKLIRSNMRQGCQQCLLPASQMLRWWTWTILIAHLFSLPGT
jgi:hypothetical protein